MNVHQRVERLRAAFVDPRPVADALLVSNPVNVRYLTGFTGDSTYLLLTADDAIMLSDGRYEVQLAQQCPDLSVRLRGPDRKMLQLVHATLVEAGYATVAIEPESVTHGFVSNLSAQEGTPEIVAAPSLIERLRAVKDSDEIELLRRSVEITQQAFRVVRSGPIEQLSEREFAFQLEEQIRRFGGEGCSFQPIVAAGPGSALPHYQPSGAAAAQSPLLLVDWGSFYAGYASDMTRMIWTGPIEPEMQKVYEIVQQAQQAAIEAIRPGVPRSAIDRAARQVIEAAGYGEAFNHAVGHGIGLEIHEAPRMASSEEEPLEPGMVVTVEPGIYLPGRFGVRLEDDILVTADGRENLSVGAPGLDDPAWLR